MPRLPMLLSLAAALAASSALAQPGAPSMSICRAPAALAIPQGKAPDLAGQWDFLMEVGTTPSRGVMALGHIDGVYGGALTPYATNTVVVRRLSLAGDAVTMSVASREGEVRFDGRLTGAGDTMCGIVTYHGGRLLPMVAVQRPSSYRDRAAR